MSLAGPIFDDRCASRFLYVWLGPLAFSLLISAILSLVVDPCLVFNTGLWPALDDARLNNGRVAKAEQVRRGGFDTVVFGSSRVHLGIDPRSPVFNGRRVYNAGLPQSQLGDHLDLIDLGLQEGTLPKQVVLLLQRDQFTQMKPEGNENGRWRIAPGRNPLEHILDHLLSYGSVTDAVTVLQDHRRLQQPETELTEAGMYTDALGMGHLTGTPLSIRARFRAKLSREWELHAMRGKGVRGLDRLQHAVQALCAAGKEVHLAVSPIHALQLALWFDLEGPEPYAEMLHGLASVVSGPGTGCARLWDFSGFSGLRGERIPAAEGAGDLSLFYLESSHFTPAAGDMMLSQMLAGARPDARLPGFPIRKGNVRADIARLVAEQTAFEASAETDLAFMRALRTGER